MADAKLERLLNLTAALLDTRLPLSAEQLHRRVGGYPDEDASFRRQFERDKEALREMGVPIRLEDVPGTLPAVQGYRIEPSEYYLPDPGLHPDELAALHLAARGVRLEGSGSLGGLWKLGGALEPPDGDTPGLLPEGAVTLPADPNLSVLSAAIWDAQRVRLSTGEVAREVDPYRLSFTRGRWYLQGFDRRHDELRTYRLDRLDGEVEVVGEPGAFERPAVDGPALSPWEVGVAEPVEARVLLDATVAPIVGQELGSAVVEDRREDGSVVVRLVVTNPEGFRGFVLGLLDHAEVLSPPALRDDLIAWLRRCAGEVAA